MQKKVYENTFPYLVDSVPFEMQDINMLVNHRLEHVPFHPEDKFMRISIAYLKEGEDYNGNGTTAVWPSGIADYDKDCSFALILEPKKKKHGPLGLTYFFCNVLTTYCLELHDILFHVHEALAWFYVLDRELFKTLAVTLPQKITTIAAKFYSCGGSAPESVGVQELSDMNPNLDTCQFFCDGFLAEKPEDGTKLYHTRVLLRPECLLWSDSEKPSGLVRFQWRVTHVYWTSERQPLPLPNDELDISHHVINEPPP